MELLETTLNGNHFSNTYSSYFFIKEEWRTAKNNEILWISALSALYLVYFIIIFIIQVSALLSNINLLGRADAQFHIVNNIFGNMLEQWKRIIEFIRHKLKHFVLVA